MSIRSLDVVRSFGKRKIASWGPSLTLRDTESRRSIFFHYRAYSVQSRPDPRQFGVEYANAGVGTRPTWDCCEINGIWGVEHTYNDCSDVKGVISSSNWLVKPSQNRRSCIKLHSARSVDVNRLFRHRLIVQNMRDSVVRVVVDTVSILCRLS